MISDKKLLMGNGLTKYVFFQGSQTLSGVGSPQNPERNDGGWSAHSCSAHG